MQRLARSVAVVTSLVVVAGGTACSSSSSGSGVTDGGFGIPDDSSAGAHDSGAGKKKDGGMTPPPKDAGPKPPQGDGSCGSPNGSTWCEENAPTINTSSNVLCDDFDVGTLSSLFGYEGVGRGSYVNSHYVSPYCGLHTFIGDGGGYPAPGDAGFIPVGSYTEHAYTSVAGAGGTSLAFDLFVPSAAACEGAVVGRIVLSAGDSHTDAAVMWLTVSGLSAGADGGSDYTLGLNAQVELGASGGTPAQSTTVKVTPRAADHGWARLELDVSAYSILSNPATITGSAEWFYPSVKTAAGKATAVSVSGTLTTTAAGGEALLDVGVIADPATGLAPPGCEVFVDNFVSNLITN